MKSIIILSAICFSFAFANAQNISETSSIIHDATPGSDEVAYLSSENLDSFEYSVESDELRCPCICTYSITNNESQRSGNSSFDGGQCDGEECTLGKCDSKCQSDSMLKKVKETFPSPKYTVSFQSSICKGD